MTKFILDNETNTPAETFEELNELDNHLGKVETVIEDLATDDVTVSLKVWPKVASGEKEGEIIEVTVKNGQ
jgi:hypothetical protein